jgi:preprotein translocase subunit SecG
MRQTLSIFQVITSVILIVLVLIQARGTGFGRTGGGGGSAFTRRGLEKLIFRSTFVFVAIFLTLSILSLLI